MARYAAHGKCRRSSLLAHFGEGAKPPRGGCCDVCARAARGGAAPPVPDAPSIRAATAKALSAIDDGSKKGKPITLAMAADKMTGKDCGLDKAQRDALALDLLVASDK